MRIGRDGSGSGSFAVTAGAAGAALALLACASTPSGGETDPLAFETLFSATQSGIEEKRHEVVRDPSAWTRVWGEIHGLASAAPPAPAVDFTREMLILVALGTRPTGGFAVKVRSVEARGDRLEVEVLESCPPPGAMVTTALTQPVEVVRVAAQPGAPAFKEKRDPSCR